MMLKLPTSQQILCFKGSCEPSLAVREQPPQTTLLVTNRIPVKQIPVKNLRAYYLPVREVAVDTISTATDLNKQQRHLLIRQFSGKLQELSSNNKLNKEHVQALILKIAPDINVRVENIQAKPEFDGAIAQCVTDYPTKDGDCNLIASSTLYIDFSASDKRIIQNTVHEFTHLLQDNTQPIKILAEQSSRYGGVNKLSNAFRDFESKFLDKFYVNGMLQHQEDIVSILKKSTLKDPTEEFNFLTLENTDLCEKYFEEALESKGIKDKSFATKFFIQQLKDEIEAYKEGFQTKKELADLPKGCPIIQDLVPRLYSQIISFMMSQKYGNS